MSLSSASLAELDLFSPIEVSDGECVQLPTDSLPHSDVELAPVCAYGTGATLLKSDSMEVETGDSQPKDLSDGECQALIDAEPEMEVSDANMWELAMKDTCQVSEDDEESWEDAQPPEWRDWQNSCDAEELMSQISTEAGDSVEEDKDDSSIAERIWEGLDPTFVQLFLGSNCERNLVHLDMTAVRLEPANILENKPLVEGFIIEFPSKVATLKRITKLLLLIDELAGGGLLKEKQSRARSSKARLEAFKLRLLLSYARKLARKCPRARDERIQQLKDLQKIPKYELEKAKADSQMLWARALMSEISDDEDEDNGDVFTIPDSADEASSGTLVAIEDGKVEDDPDGPARTDTVRRWPGRPACANEVIESVASLGPISVTPTMQRQLAPKPTKTKTTPKKTTKKKKKGSSKLVANLMKKAVCIIRPSPTFERVDGDAGVAPAIPEDNVFLAVLFRMFTYIRKTRKTAEHLKTGKHVQLGYPIMRSNIWKP